MKKHCIKSAKGNAELEFLKGQLNQLILESRYQLKMIKYSVSSLKDAIKLSNSIEKTQSSKLLSAIKYTEHLIKMQYLTFDRASFSS